MEQIEKEFSEATEGLTGQAREVSRTLAIIQTEQKRIGQSISDEVTRVARIKKAREQLEAIVGLDEAEKLIGELPNQ